MEEKNVPTTRASACDALIFDLKNLDVFLCVRVCIYNFKKYALHIRIILVSCSFLLALPSFHTIIALCATSQCSKKPKKLINE